MIQMQNCQQMINSLRQIRKLKIDLQNAIDIRNTQEGLEIKTQLEKLIQEAKPVFIIEQKKFPITLLRTCGKAGAQLAFELENSGINGDMKSELRGPKFHRCEPGETIAMVSLTVGDLFSDNHTHAYAEIFAQATISGLGKLPHEVGPDLLLKEKTQPKMGEWLMTVMDPILDRQSDPIMFSLGRNEEGVCLSFDWTELNQECNPDHALIFRVNLSTSKAKIN